jgi:hypothetical protein
MLNDTAAIAAMPDTNLQKHESRTTSVEKIANGYVTTESSNKDGLYESRKTYSENPPLAATDQGDSLMRRAVDYMKRDGTL